MRKNQFTKNFIPVIILVLVLAISSCNQPNQLAEENLKIVEQYQAALKKYDYEAMGALLSEDFMGYGPSLSDSMNKNDALINWKHNMEHLYDKLEFRGVENIVLTNFEGKVPGQWVSSWGRFVVKYKGNSNEAVIWANNIYLIYEGKITKSYIFYNEADALRQMGYSYVFQNPN